MNSNHTLIINDSDKTLFFESWMKKDYLLTFFSWTQRLNILELCDFYGIKYSKQYYASWAVPIPFEEYNIQWPEYKEEYKNKLIVNQ